MEAGETSLGGLEMREVMNCYRDNCSETAVKLFSFADVILVLVYICEHTCVHCME